MIPHRLDAVCQRLFELDAKRTQGEIEATAFGIRQKKKPYLTLASYFTGNNTMDDCEYFAAMPEAISIIREYQRREKVYREALAPFGAGKLLPLSKDDWVLLSKDQVHALAQALAQLGEVG